MKKSFHSSVRVISVFLIVAMLSAFVPAFAIGTNAATITQNQANMVARCDYMYNATWVSQKTITSWKSQSYFYAGSTYRVPYAWPVTAGKWVGDTSYGISVATFLAATTDATSEFYTKQSYYTGNTGSYAPYYGNDCSTFVTYCWGLSSRRTTSTLANAATLIGSTTTANVNAYLKVGDALNYAGSHVVFISDIVYDASGAISSIEVTEQTPPQLKRTNHTVASLVSKYGANYKIYRYSGTVSAPPSGAGVVTGSTNPNSYTVPTTALSSGASGSGVSWIQAVLSQLGYSITVDGSYGSATTSTVAQFQKDYGLTSTGTADLTTIAKLQALWNDKRGYYTTTTNLNMRAGAGTSYSILASIPSGTQVAVVGFNSAGTWANVIYNGTSGWASMSYLTYVRRFNYVISYNTNTTTTLASLNAKHSQCITVASPPAHPDGLTLRGWQLLRASDWVWYNGSTWVSDQASSKLFSPGEIFTISDSMISALAGDDTYYFCAVWNSGTSSGGTTTTVTTVTPSTPAPSGYGWQWPSDEAYGYMGNYGGNNQDIELSVDVALLASSQTSSLAFYDANNTIVMTVDPSTVTIGSTSVSYNWGEQSLDNWHNVKFKVLNGTAYAFIDGVLIAQASGITANESYQLLFCYTGEMIIDNAIMMSSTGTTYFDCDFEDAAESENLMGTGLGYRTLIGGSSSSVGTVTSNEVAPSKYGWQWPQSEAYGYMGNYGGNGQDIELCVDLALLSSSETSVAALFTNGTSNSMKISPTTVTVGSTSVSYDWGALGLDNWHDVKFKILDGIGYVFIDGELIASESGITANTDYQLLFSLTGEMAIDNAVMMSSTGTTYFDCDFEDASEASTLMGEGLGARTFLFADTSDFTVVLSPNSSSITGTGEVTFVATPSAGEGHTYSWSSSISALNSYMTQSGNTCTISIPSELSSAVNATITCTATSDGGVTNSGSASFTYNTLPVPTISSISPSAASVTGTGIASYTVTASGDGLIYSWSSSNAALNSYLSGTTGSSLVVNITEELSSAFSATLTCTVMNSYGKTATKTATFNYTPAPVPTISAISPASATITGTGSATFTATASGDDLTYQWTSSDPALDSYLSGTDTATLTVNITEELSSSVVSALTCTVTNKYGKNATAEATVTYEAVTGPTLSSVSPAAVSITGTGTATFTATAEGTDLTYKWTSSDSALDAYMSGADTSVLTINIPAELESAFTATLTCTVTDSYGKTAEKAAKLSYKLTPVPTIDSITPESASIEGPGTVTYTATATGDGLTYSWSSSNSALDAYLSGTDTAVLTVNIPTELANDITATITLTVTNSYGNTATATAEFEYTVTLDGGFVVTMLGDIDGDGAINAKDTNTITRIVAGVVTATEAQMAAGDVNSDGDVNGIDANILARYAAGLITEF